MKAYDLIIVGAGPAGLFSAFYAGRRNMKTLLVEASDVLGGLPYSIYSEKNILDVPGFSSITGYDLTKRLIEQSQSEMLTIMTGTKVISYVGNLEKGFIVNCENSDGPIKIKAASILLATGLGKVTPRKMNIPGEDDFLNRGVSYYLESKESILGKKIVIAGGGDSALDWADMAEGLAKEIRLVHRRDDFRAQEESVRRLHESSAILHLNSQVTSIYGKDFLEYVEITHNNKTTKKFPCDLLIVAFGFKIQLDTFSNWGLQVEQGGIVTGPSMETNVPGIFAAGDVAFTPGVGTTKLIAVGFAQGTIAVNMAKIRIDPKANFYPGHSTAWKI